jgi:hypothetical protein
MKKTTNDTDELTAAFSPEQAAALRAYVDRMGKELLAGIRERVRRGQICGSTPEVRRARR